MTVKKLQTETETLRTVFFKVVLRNFMPGILSIGASFTVQANGLMDIYAMAKQNDTDIQIAEARYQAQIQAKPIARANLLPQASITANTAYNRRKTQGVIYNVQGGSVDFNEHGYSLRISQALYHHGFYVQLRQAKNSVAKAKIDLDTVQQNLMLRAAAAYFDILAAQDTLRFRESEKEAIKRQLGQVKKRFEVGLIAITDVYEAQASYDLVVAREIEARNALETTKYALEVIIARRLDELRTLSGRMQLVLPEPDDAEEWVRKSLDQNLALLSSEYATQIARQMIKLQRAQHLPTLDAVVSHSEIDTGGLSGARKSKDNRIGLELGIPLLQGGRIHYQAKQAHYNAMLAEKQHEKIIRETIQATRDAYLNVISGISRVKALAQALESTQVAADATRAGFQEGTRTSVDVSLALQETFLAKRDYSRARYDYLLNTLRLKQAAGTLGADDLLNIDGWLH